MLPLILTLVLAILVLAICLAVVRRDRNYWILSYNSLDRGSEELEEGYQQEILSLEEYIERYKRFLREVAEDRDELIQVVADHEANCLIPLKEIEFKNAATRAQLDALRKKLTAEI